MMMSASHAYTQIHLYMSIQNHTRTRVKDHLEAVLRRLAHALAPDHVERLTCLGGVYIRSDKNAAAASHIHKYVYMPPLDPPPPPPLPPVFPTWEVAQAWVSTLSPGSTRTYAASRFGDVAWVNGRGSVCG